MNGFENVSALNANKNVYSGVVQGVLYRGQNRVVTKIQLGLQDGLNDNVETDTGTFVDASDTGSDPLDPDTDGDLMEDGWEVANGQNPCVPDKADKEETAGCVPGSSPSPFMLLALILGACIYRRGHL